MDYLNSFKITWKKIKLPIQQSHLMFRKKYVHTYTRPIMLEIVNNGPFIPFQLVF
jgi:hypothetical protein